MRRTLEGSGNTEIARAVAEHARTAFDALEPALADYATRPVA